MSWLKEVNSTKCLEVLFECFWEASSIFWCH